MNTEILTSEWNNVKTIKAFNKRDDWWLEVQFVGGAKATTRATAAEVNQIEYDLREKGWQIDPSLFCSGFNAKPVLRLGSGCILSVVEGPVEVEEFIFAMPDLWPDEYAVESYV